MARTRSRLRGAKLEEETGCAADGDFIALGTFRQPGGKTIAAWGVEGDFDLGNFRSNVFSLEWPPRSGRMQEFPEADRAQWFPPDQAIRKILKGQAAILSKLLERLRSSALSTQRKSAGTL